MNALFISNDPSIFDAQSSARLRMRAYAKEIGNLHILSKGPHAAPCFEDVGDGASLTLHSVSARKPWLFLRMCSEARALIEKEAIQIVSAQDPFEYGWVAMKAVKGTKARLHLQLHTDPFSPWFTRSKIWRSSEVRMPLINQTRKRLADKVFPCARGIRVVSKRVQASLIARYRDRIVSPVVIPIAVSSEVPSALPLPPHPFTFVLISVGRLEAEKRVQDTLQALALIHHRYQHVGLVVVGEGSERRILEEFAKKLGISENVLFLGHQENAWGLMQSAQAFIQSSAYEGYSRTLLEAALARVPIITTDVGIVGEVFKGYEDVLAVPPGDPTGLAAHIVGLVEDSGARKQFSLAAEKTARDYLASVHASPADIAQDLRKVLEMPL